jgi:hypothetical protein
VEHRLAAPPLGITAAEHLSVGQGGGEFVTFGRLGFGLRIVTRPSPGDPGRMVYPFGPSESAALQRLGPRSNLTLFAVESARPRLRGLLGGPPEPAVGNRPPRIYLGRTIGNIRGSAAEQLHKVLHLCP